jgi:hypothetical protein
MTDLGSPPFGLHPLHGTHLNDLLRSVVDAEALIARVCPPTER